MLFSALWDSAPDPGTELIPSGTLEPITASWEPGPVEEESPGAPASVGSVSPIPRDIRRLTAPI